MSVVHGVSESNDAALAEERSRADAVDQYRIGTATVQEVLDDITSVAAALAETPMAAVILVDDMTQWQVSTVGFPHGQDPRHDGVCENLVTSRQSLVVTDLSDSPYRDRPAIAGAPHLRFYAGVPLIDTEGYAIGTLCTLDTRVRQISPERMEGMAALARRAVDALEMGRMRSRERVQRRRLGEVEAVLTSLLEHTATPVYVKDASGRYLHANAALHHLLGLPPGSLIGRQEQDVVAPEVWAQHARNDAEVLESGGSKVFEEVAFDADGVEHTFASTKFCVWPRPGSAPLVAGISVDLTPIRRAGEAAEAARRQLAATQSLAGIGSWWEDGETGTLVWSDALRELLAVPSDFSTDGALLWSMLPDESRSLLAPDAPRSQQGNTLLVGRLGAPVDVPIRRWDGKVHMFQARVERDPDSPAGAPLFRGTLQDVTMEREAEQALRMDESRSRQLFDLLPDGVVVVGEDGRILDINANAGLLFGYGRAELVGRPVEQLVPAELHDAHRRHRHARAASGRPDMTVRARDLKGRRKDGGLFPVEIRLASVHSDRGTATVATVRDVSEAQALRRALQSTNELIAGVLAGATEMAVIAVDSDLRVTLWSRGAAGLLGYSEEHMTGRPLSTLFASEAEAGTAGTGGVPLLGHVMPGRPLSDTATLVRADGSDLIATLTVSALVDGEQEVTGYVLVAADVTDRVAAEREVAASEERYRSAFDHAPVGVALLEATGSERGTMVRVNRALCELAGYTDTDLIGRHLGSLIHPEDAASFAGALTAAVAGGAERPQTDLRCTHRDGHDRWVHLSLSVIGDGARPQPGYVVAQLQDITERRRTEADLRHRVLHDPLTGLANRTLLMDHLAQALLRAERQGRRVGVLFVDLDDFKLVNDALGHEAGDRFLAGVAVRISGAIREVDTAARFGGDEFVVVCEDVGKAFELHAIAERITAALLDEIDVGGTMLQPSASVGVACSTPGVTAEELLRDADAAMYVAKLGGKGRWKLTEAHPADSPVDEVEEGLRRALAANQLQVHYQPSYDLDSGRLVAVEALVRWEHPQRGLLAAADWIEVAEQRGVIGPIGEWALREACTQGAAWAARYGPAAPEIWVNVSGRQLRHNELTGVVRDALGASGLEPTLLWVEIAERQVAVAAQSLLADLAQLPAMGVRISLDDFGNGHKGLDYLRQLPVAGIKVHPAFVAGLGVDPTDTALTNSVIALGATLDLTVVATGVEQEGQLEHLRTLGCDRAQGYLLGAPAPAGRIDELLAAGAASRTA